MTTRCILAVDTGASGSIAFNREDGKLVLQRLESDRFDLYRQILLLSVVGGWADEFYAVVESVQPRSGARAGAGNIRMSSSSACAMCRNHERVIGALLAAGIPSRDWRPQSWMAHIEGLPRGSGEGDRKKRKAFIADYVRRRWAANNIPLYSADAVAMLSIALDGKGP